MLRWRLQLNRMLALISSPHDCDTESFVLERTRNRHCKQTVAADTKKFDLEGWGHRVSIPDSED